jgi:hypothetical protein
MRLIDGPVPNEYVLEFQSAEECDTFLSDVEKEGYFSLDASHLPRNATFRTRTIGSPRSRQIRPLQITKGLSGYRIQITLKPTPPKAPAEPSLQRNDQESDDEARPRNLFEKIRSLTVSERVTLALKADLMERKILMQENNSKINDFLLRNIRITEQEVAAIARNPVSPLQTILTIFNHKNWMNCEGIRAGIITNPKLPPHLALDLIPRLSAGDLIKMSHAKFLREDLHRAVRRELKKRGIQIKESAAE